MNRRTFLGLFAALGTTAGCLGSHPLPPVRGRVVRTSVVGVHDGEANVLLTTTPDEVDLGDAVRGIEPVAESGESSGGGDAGASAPRFTVPPAVHDALLDQFDDVTFHVTVEHRCRVRVYGVHPGDRLRYRTRVEVYRRVFSGDRMLFTIRPAGSPHFQNTNSVVREGTVRRKRLLVGPSGDLRTALSVTPDGVSRGEGPDVSLPMADERLEELRDRFPTVRLAVDVEHAVGDRTFARTYTAERRPFNRLEPGADTRFAVETADTDDGGPSERIPTLDPDSPFYDDEPW